MNATRIPSIGAISEGTMRDDDILPTFLSELRQYDPTRADEIESAYPWINDDDYADVDADDLAACNKELWGALEDCAPAYIFFGSTEGDGACYGFWPAYDAAETSEDVLKIETGDPWHYCLETGQIAVFGRSPFVREASYVLVISDHGNATLIDAATGREV